MTKLTAKEAQAIINDCTKIVYTRHMQFISGQIKDASEKCKNRMETCVPAGVVLDRIKNELEGNGFFCEVEPYIYKDGTQRLRISWAEPAW